MKTIYKMLLVVGLLIMTNCREPQTQAPIEQEKLLYPSKKTVYDFPYADIVDAGDLNCNYLNKDLIDDGLDRIIESLTLELTQENLNELSQDFLKYFDALKLTYQEGDSYKRLRSIRDKLLPYRSNKKIQHIIYVYKDSISNAFTIFNGDIFITEGLLSEIKDDDILAGIIGHEMGHGQNKHLDGIARLCYSLNNASDDNSTILNSLKTIGIASIGALYKLVSNYTGQSQELEADISGCYLASQAGYNPKDVAMFWKSRSSTDLTDSTFYRKAKQSIFRTHPFAEDRYHCIKDYCNLHVSDLSKFKSFNQPREVELIFKCDTNLAYHHPNKLSRVSFKPNQTERIIAHGLYKGEYFIEDEKSSWLFVSNKDGLTGWMIDDYVKTNETNG